MATTAVERQPFVAPFESVNKDFGTVFWEFLSSKQKDIIKLFGYATGWTSVSLPSDHPTGQLCGRVSGFMGDTKNLLSAIEIPEKTANLRKAVTDFIAEPSFEGARKVALKELTGLINPVCDGIDLSSKFIPLTSEAMRAVKTINFTATLVGAGNSAVEQVQKINNLEEIDTKKTALHLINIARDVSYVALAVIGLSSIFLGFAAAPWMFLTCLTSGLLFTIGGFFYDRVVVNLDNKHTDLNRENANLIAEVTYLRPAQNAV